MTSQISNTFKELDLLRRLADNERRKQSINDENKKIIDELNELYHDNKQRVLNIIEQYNASTKCLFNGLDPNKAYGISCPCPVHSAYCIS